MRSARVGSLGTFGYFLLFLVFAGCGGSSGVDERSSGSAKAADPAAKSALATAPVELADTGQFAKVLDLSKLPAPEGAKITEQLAAQLRVAVPLSVPAATEFYLGKLQALGWQRVGDPASATITESFAQVGLGHEGYQLSLTVLPGKPKEANVSISHLGNLEAKTLPKLDGAEEQYSLPSSTLYFTALKVDEATTSLRRLLTAAGWQEYERTGTQMANRPDMSNLLFRKKVYSLGVSISKPAAQPGKSAVQYQVSTLSHDLPAPADAKHIEIQESRWTMACEIPRDLAAAADYYRKALPAVGFAARPHETPIGKELILSFESDGRDVVVVHLKAAEEHATKVNLEGYSAAFRAAMEKAGAEAKVKREAREKADLQEKAEKAKAFAARFKQQDDAINAAIKKATSEAMQPAKQPKPTQP